jgi:hypothetical protein
MTSPSEWEVLFEGGPHSREGRLAVVKSRRFHFNRLAVILLVLAAAPACALLLTCLESYLVPGARPTNPEDLVNRISLNVGFPGLWVVECVLLLIFLRKFIESVRVLALGEVFVFDTHQGLQRNGRTIAQFSQIEGLLVTVFRRAGDLDKYRLAVKLAGKRDLVIVQSSSEADAVRELHRAIAAVTGVLVYQVMR